MQEKINILVTGANGQLGSELQEISTSKTELNFIFTDKNELDITNFTEVSDFFKQNQFDFCINCAAHTAVDKAEEEIELSRLLNVTAAENLANACNKHHVAFIHISSDFVFSGNKNRPYQETDIPDPISVYGKTKLEGEHVALSNNGDTIVIRTSWLYSSYGNNFVKTMLKLAKDRNALNVICDQIGSPTYTADLAKGIISIVESNKIIPGVYHYSNEGVASWYDFAVAIFDLAKVNMKISPIPTEQYPTPAKRPQYSVMDKSKIKNNYELEIPYWRDSLAACINKL